MNTARKIPAVFRGAPTLRLMTDDSKAPDSKLEQAAAAILRGIESLNHSEGQIAGMLERAVRRIGEEATEREAKRAKVVDTNLTLISEALQGLRLQFDALSPRVTALEGTLPTTAAHFDHIKAEMAELRRFMNERFEQFAAELETMRESDAAASRTP